MDIGGTLTRAWAITWRCKVLWVLGFLVALGQGSNGVSPSYQFSAGDFQNGRWPNFDLSPLAGGLLVGLACLAILVGIALFVISVMARGGLIAGVAQADEQGAAERGATTLGSAWAAGRRRFWTLFGIGVLAILPVILVGLAMGLVIFLLAGGAAIGGASSDEDVAPIMASLIAFLCPSVCFMVILVALLAQIRIYAERAAVLEGRGWLDAFGRGWQVLRRNLGPTILLWVVFVVLGLVVGAIVLAITAPILLPLAGWFSTSTGTSEPNRAILASVCGLGLIGMIVGAIVGAVINTFTSATWTVAYRQMTAPRI